MFFTNGVALGRGACFCDAKYPKTLKVQQMIRRRGGGVVVVVWCACEGGRGRGRGGRMFRFGLFFEEFVRI